MTAVPAVRPDGGLTACPDCDCGVYGICPECVTARDARRDTAH